MLNKEGAQISLNKKDESVSVDDTISIDKNDMEKVTSLKKKCIIGYKHKLTGKIYHHAIVQTSPSPWKYELMLKFHRNSQTVEVQDKAQQTSTNACTQVHAQNIFNSSDSNNTLEYMKDFEYSDDIKEEFLSKVIILQKYARRWLACQEMLRRKNCLFLQQLWDKEQLKLRALQDVNWLKSLQERRLNPKTEDDFKLIFSDLQKWWENEAKSIAPVKSRPDIKSAKLLLIYEVQKIVQINKKKQLFMQRHGFVEKERFLEMAAHPNLWKTYDSVVQVETESTEKGRYIHEIYQTLSLKYLSPQDRMNALSSLKEVLQPYHCKLTNSLVQLANREIDLIRRGTKSDRLEGLRNRIQYLFWQFAKQPIHNPQMTKLKEKDIKLQHVLCCAACQKFYTIQYEVAKESIGQSVLANYSTKCRNCLYIENEAWKRKDLEFYKRLLKVLLSEEGKSNISGLVYILQPCDIKHLVENVWKRRSCISGLAKEDDLELTRYDFKKNWTPWNCILVTKEEAETLKKTSNLENIYDHKFKKCVKQKHSEAKMYFSNIPRFLPYIPSMSGSSNRNFQ